MYVGFHYIGPLPQPSSARAPHSSQTKMFNNTTGWQNQGRGAYRPPFTRGGFSPRYDRFAGTKPQTPRSPSPPLGSVVRCLKADEILNHKAGNGVDRDARITDCKYVASFNWLDGEKPTILVPGITISATERLKGGITTIKDASAD